MTTANAVAVSAVIPMRNEERYVGSCLDSILAQIEGRDDVEILCVDGNSSDRTPEIVQAYASRDDRIRLIPNPEQIVPTALNRAIDEIRSPLMIRLDCHCHYAEDYVASCVEVLERTGADAVGGVMTTKPGVDGPVGRAIAAATSSRFGVGGSVFRTGGQEQEADAVPFGCFRRDVFDRFGRFDERLVRNQDIEMYSRIRAGGGKVVLSPKIRLTYFNRSTYAGLRQQSFNNGLWNLFTVYLTGRGLSLRHFVPFAFVSSLLLLGIAGVFWRPAWGLLAADLLVYVAAASVAAWKAAKGRANPFLILLAFVQLHVVYGLGTLWGLVAAPVRFGLRRRRGPGRALGDRRE